MKINTLAFDTSGSAIVRFFDVPAKISVHWANAKVAHLWLTCPDSIGLVAGFKCRACEAGARSAERHIAPGWDVTMGRWCLFMSHPLVFSEVFRKCLDHGVSVEMMKSGMGPDVILQRVGNRTLSEVAPETIAQPRGKGKRPAFLALMEAVQKRSHYVNQTVQELEAAYSPLKVSDGYSGLEGQIASQGAHGTPENMPQDGGEPPDGDEMDGLIGHDRWDFVK